MQATHKRNVVVVGASAGGVPALTTLFSHLPENLPAAVLVVLHIPPYAPSSLQRVISRATQLRVLAAEDGMQLEEGTVYVGVPDRHILIDDGRVRLTRGPKECRARPAVDALFRSAAIKCGPRTIGVVLSGALDDGTAGLWAIKDRGGLAFVQEPSQAEYSSMPESAIQQVKTDFVGSIESIAQQIVKRCDETIEEPDQVSSDRMLAENAIAGGANGMDSGIMDLGKVSRYTCPECHGVLVQIEEGPIVRFRCHTGHAFSIKSLMAELSSEIDRGLWDTLRGIEEKLMLFRQAAELAEKSGDQEKASKYRQIAEKAEGSLEPLRELVRDADLFDDQEM